MLALTDIGLGGLATHYAGNKANGDDFHLAKELVEVDSAELKHALLQYFLTPFQEAASYHFWHPADLQLNEVMHFAKAIFDDPEQLLFQSCNVARHLHDVTDLPNIKAGEVHVA